MVGRRRREPREHDHVLGRGAGRGAGRAVGGRRPIVDLRRRWLICGPGDRRRGFRHRARRWPRGQDRSGGGGRRERGVGASSRPVVRSVRGSDAVVIGRRGGERREHDRVCAREARASRGRGAAVAPIESIVDARGRRLVRRPRHGRRAVRRRDGRTGRDRGGGRVGGRVEKPGAGVQEDLAVLDASRRLVPAGIERVVRVPRLIVGRRGIADRRDPPRAVRSRRKRHAVRVVRLSRAPDMGGDRRVRHGVDLHRRRAEQAQPSGARPERAVDDRVGRIRLCVAVDPIVEPILGRMRRAAIDAEPDSEEPRRRSRRRPGQVVPHVRAVPSIAVAVRGLVVADHEETSSVRNEREDGALFRLGERCLGLGDDEELIAAEILWVPRVSERDRRSGRKRFDRMAGLHEIDRPGRDPAGPVGLRRRGGYAGLRRRREALRIRLVRRSRTRVGGNRKIERVRVDHPIGVARHLVLRRVEQDVRRTSR